MCHEHQGSGLSVREVRNLYTTYLSVVAFLLLGFLRCRTCVYLKPSESYITGRNSFGCPNKVKTEFFSLILLFSFPLYGDQLPLFPTHRSHLVWLIW
jgi:hypothetical protein